MPTNPPPTSSLHSIGEEKQHHPEEQSQLLLLQRNPSPHSVSTLNAFDSWPNTILTTSSSSSTTTNHHENNSQSSSLQSSFSNSSFSSSSSSSTKSVLSKDKDDKNDVKDVDHSMTQQHTCIRTSKFGYLPQGVSSLNSSSRNRGGHLTQGHQRCASEDVSSSHHMMMYHQHSNHHDVEHTTSTAIYSSNGGDDESTSLVTTTTTTTSDTKSKYNNNLVHGISSNMDHNDHPKTTSLNADTSQKNTSSCMNHSRTSLATTTNSTSTTTTTESDNHPSPTQSPPSMMESVVDDDSSNDPPSSKNTSISNTTTSTKTTNTMTKTTTSSPSTTQELGKSRAFSWTTKKGQSEESRLKFLKDTHVEERKKMNATTTSYMKKTINSNYHHQDRTPNTHTSSGFHEHHSSQQNQDFQRRLSECLPSIFTDWKRVIDFQSTCMLVLIILDYTFMIVETCVKKGWLNGAILTTLCVIGFMSVKWSFLRDLPHYVNVNDSSVWKSIGSLQDLPNSRMNISEKKKDESWVTWLSSYMPNRFSSTQLVFLNLVLFSSKFLLAESKSVVTPMSLFSIASIAGCKYRDSFIRNRKDFELQQHPSLKNDEDQTNELSKETSADLEAVLWSQVPFYYIALHYVCYMAYKTFQFFSSIEKPLTTGEIFRELLTFVIDYFPSVSMVLIFGGFVVFASVYISIEYKKLTDIAKKLSQALEVKNTFLSHVSHELRTPLLSSLGSIELLKETNLNNEQAGHLEVIQASNSVLLTLIEDIFLFIDLDRAPKNMTPMNTRKAYDDNPSIEHNSGTELTRFQEHSSAFSISKSIHTILDILQNYSSKFQIKIECYIDDSVKSLIVFANQTRLQQCMLNILTNAVKASKPNGVVELYCSKVEPQPQLSEKHLSSMNRDMKNVEWFEISIVDHGIGIPKDKQKAIFEPFQQLHNLNEAICPGTGLGLCTAKRIVDQMGGWIDLQSEPNIGSTFTLYLPFQVESIHVTTNEEKEQDAMTMNIQSGFSSGQTSGNESTTSELDRSSSTNLPFSQQQVSSSGGGDVSDSSESSSKNNNIPSTLKLSEINSPLHNAIQRQLQIQENYLEQFEKTQQIFNESPRPKSSNSKIIVAEDNSINRQVLLKLLSNLGFGQADAVCDGQELIEAFDVNKHKLILTDMHMPKKNGLEASQIIRQKYQDQVKIIMLTADALTDFSTEQYMRTVDAVLCKPCTKQKLKETIETFLK
ncbi:hypothetical protein FDP41_012599 [Naegleria fowleri]|uniref:histidine kinase n=1 Tax=Naegleria fowleri TaxID=5763 RepID=A0A6A5C7U0_NAEFO|nr:uncharacterized protein FDP41_012599 [Naegleria fowleri]KAF0981339.1 hypothetical protein FDP41_012599 [Naegleria fowleri]